MSTTIAMWSGPRNISTAMMRAWGARPDTLVCDEPFYAHYLLQTGFTHHPGYQEIIANHENDWRKVVRLLQRPLPAGKKICYQKQMAQHLLPHISLDWTESLTNVFLIRDPREMLLSLLKVLPNPSLDETGLPQQVKLFDRLRHRVGGTPLVLDAKETLLSPRETLRELCARAGLQFVESMLHWQPGIHPTDGVWAQHWYDNVANSSTFAAYRERAGELPPQHRELLAQCQELYDRLAAHKLTVLNDTRELK